MRQSHPSRFTIFSACCDTCTRCFFRVTRMLCIGHLLCAVFHRLYVCMCTLSLFLVLRIRRCFPLYSAWASLREVSIFMSANCFVFSPDLHVCSFFPVCVFQSAWVPSVVYVATRRKNVTPHCVIHLEVAREETRGSIEIRTNKNRRSTRDPG